MFKQFFDADIFDDLCDNSDEKEPVGNQEENCTGEQKTHFTPNANLGKQEEGVKKENVPENHAQGMLTILDSMEKGELASNADKKVVIKESKGLRVTAEQSFDSNMTSTKQSKLTDFFKK